MTTLKARARFPLLIISLRKHTHTEGGGERERESILEWTSAEENEEVEMQIKGKCALLIYTQITGWHLQILQSLG